MPQDTSWMLLHGRRMCSPYTTGYLQCPLHGKEHPKFLHGSCATSMEKVWVGCCSWFWFWNLIGNVVSALQLLLGLLWGAQRWQKICTCFLTQMHREGQGLLLQRQITVALALIPSGDSQFFSLHYEIRDCFEENDQSPQSGDFILGFYSTAVKRV